MPKFDSAKDTIEHIELVASALAEFRSELIRRAVFHDQSKLGRIEKPLRDKYIPLLRAAVYGSQEYEAADKLLAPAAANHYAMNDHHTEHYPNGVSGMRLEAVVEMFCDWVAASARQPGGMNVDKALERCGITGQLADVLRVTAQAWAAEKEKRAA